MTPMTQLMIASAIFVGGHFALSHPLREPLMRMMGENGFRGFYSLVALASFGWMIWASYQIGSESIAEAPGDGIWLIATLVMWLASVLLAGSFAGNPALPKPREIAERDARRAPRGVYAITRHPMMWAIALWAVVHMALWPTPSNHIFAGALLILALLGAWGQDYKKRTQMGASWSRWQARTSFFPFAALLTGKAKWSELTDGFVVPLLIGTILFFAVTWAHIHWGAPAAGFWRWMGI